MAELAWATARLAQAGYPEPRRTAYRLWRETPRYQEAVERVAAGEPLPYVTGLAGFRRLTLAVDRRALIPRPETEGLVDLALAATPRGRALDLGTGSGCVALALADEGGYHEVTAVDAGADALVLARANGERLGLPVRWLQGSWCEPVAGERFDVIVTNPPYIAAGELEQLDPSVRAWEPRLALDGGPDGLRAADAVLTAAPGVLAPGGWLFMELDTRRAAATSALAWARGWHHVTISNDLFGRARYLSARRGAEA